MERRPLDFPGAFVDDGLSPHQPQRIHSPRLPSGGSSVALEGVKFLHYALVRPEAQKAKMRMYAALENVMETKSLYWRRRYYWSRRVLRAMGPVEPVPPEWYAEWERRGIDMTTIEDVQPYWQDLATLDLLLKHGSRRFWLDDIWEKDWRAFLRDQHLQGTVVPPNALLRTLVDHAQSLLEALIALRNRFTRTRAV